MSAVTVLHCWIAVGWSTSLHNALTEATFSRFPSSVKVLLYQFEYPVKILAHVTSNVQCVFISR